MPLKGIPSQLSPELLKVLAAMGHGDELILADAHFPTASICKSGPQEVRADGLRATDLLKGVMQLLPLDQYEKYPVARMDLVPSDKEAGLKTPIWDAYQQILNEAEKTQGNRAVCQYHFEERMSCVEFMFHTSQCRGIMA
ncbi:fucose mutarotase isoform X2 [Aplysia californica]|uniref:L-fucose mutarotase n=1 Tax=Aplysia californica TaxID=6500 RepID=A0ABM1VV99_APLCA|nr:fucose mutarotase isoform X2 [Aplysia californica]